MPLGCRLGCCLGQVVMAAAKHLGPQWSRRGRAKCAHRVGVPWHEYCAKNVRSATCFGWSELPGQLAYVSFRSARLYRRGHLWFGGAGIRRLPKRIPGLGRILGSGCLAAYRPQLFDLALVVMAGARIFVTTIGSAKVCGYAGRLGSEAASRPSGSFCMWPTLANVSRRYPRSSLAIGGPHLCRLVAMIGWIGLLGLRGH